MPPLRVYPLLHSSEEVRAAACAKTSRSAKNFDEIMATIDEDKAAGFFERIFDGYNHDSVAEMASVPLAVEKVSIVVSKVLESNRRGVYQEKSTRYQEFSRADVYRPPDEHDTVTSRMYEQAINTLFDAYEKLTPRMMEWAASTMTEEQRKHPGAVRGRAFDSLRYLLPCGTLTNLAMRLNALDYCDLISTMYSTGNTECHAVATAMKAALATEIPSLLNRATFNDWKSHIHTTQRSWGNALVNELEPYLASRSAEPVGNTGIVLLESCDGQQAAYEKVLTALIVRYTNVSWWAARSIVHGEPKKATQMFMAIMSAHVSHFQRVPQELELTDYVFSVVMDFGAYRDLQRHRRCTMIAQAIDAELGFSVPDGAIAAGCEDEFAGALSEACNLSAKLKAQGSYLHEYAAPLGVFHRSIVKQDLAQLYYEVELRSRPAGHISYRRIVKSKFDLVKAQHPLLVKPLVCDPVLDAGFHK